MSPTSKLLTQAIAKVKACYHDDHHTDQWDTESSSALYNLILYLPLKDVRCFHFQAWNIKPKLSDNFNAIRLLKIHIFMFENPLNLAEHVKGFKWKH